tara:strand:- start:716 stop:868 length:153 start_codon:yes stop_codon:yes gene_type:complete
MNWKDILKNSDKKPFSIQMLREGESELDEDDEKAWEEPFPPAHTRSWRLG